MRRQLGKYRLVRHLATGGMGEVFLALQEGPAGFSKTVVVKHLLRHLGSDRTFVAMFQNEARLAALVSHPNVVQIFELGEDDGTYFIAMEYVRGRSLREVIRAAGERGVSIPIPIAVHALVCVLRGLAAAHALIGADGRHLGLVHRDVTPENVLVAFDGPVKLADFGIAKAASVTAAGRTVARGKYGYMAPEQYRNAGLDARTDVYASGVVLYELLSGGRPFAAPHEAAEMNAILTREPTPLVELGRGVSPGISAAVDRALSKDPADRFATADEMATELEACLAEIGVSVSEATVRSFMHELFGDEATAPPTEAGEALAVTEPVEPPAPVPARRFGRGLLIGGMAFVAATLIGASAVVLYARRSKVPSTVAAASVEPLPPSEPASAVAEAPSVSASSIPSAVPAPSSDPRPHRERKAATRAPAAPAPAGSGTLSLRIRPWAEVFVDGRSFGVSPVPPIELPVGRHVVVLKNRDLHAERKLFADIAPGATATLRADLFE